MVPNFDIGSKNKILISVVFWRQFVSEDKTDVRQGRCEIYNRALDYSLRLAVSPLYGDITQVIWTESLMIS